VQTLRDEAGRHFDPELVDIALEHLDRLREVRDRWGG
jgi:response regulator RpfG family c-di-GMP phosphodiesterase